MNTPTEEAKTTENGKQRRKSIGSGGGPSLADGKTRRHSIGITSSQKGFGEEGKIVPNYLRASTGSCHDFCKFGKKHEHSKSTVPVKFKRTAVVNKDKLPKTVVPLEKKNTTPKPSLKPDVRTPVEPIKVTKKDVLLPTKKPQVHNQRSPTSGKATQNELKRLQRSASVVKSSPVVLIAKGSNVGIKANDIKFVKKVGVTPKAGTIKKAVTKVTPNESQSPKASFSRPASLKVVKSRAVKQVSPLKDQNRMQKVVPKETDAEDESEVKPETLEFDFTQPSMELVNPPVSSNPDSFSDKFGVQDEPIIIGKVSESSDLFSDKEVLEELLVVESSELCSDKESLEEDEEALMASPLSESSESFYDDEALEDESDYIDDEEAEVPEEGSDVSKMETSVGNHKISRKGKMVISEDKDDKAVKLRFRRGKILDVHSENNGPRRLKFRKGKVMKGNEDKKHVSSRRSFDKKDVEETVESTNGHESVVLKHQGEHGKKDGQGLLNNVIEETASKLVESRKSKVKALVSAFETVISLQDGKPSSS